MHVLVVYATRHGSTRGVAERLTQRLRDQGLSVDLYDLPSVVHPDAYDAVVVGSAVYGQTWLPEGRSFVRRHAGVLGAQPLWTFSVGRLISQSLLLRRIGWPDAKDVGEIARWANPVGHRFFNGSIAAPGLWFHQRMAFRLAGGRYGDFRDWPEIDAWADEIAAHLSRLTRRPVAPAPDPA